jgi:hypothetical protein
VANQAAQTRQKTTLADELVTASSQDSESESGGSIPVISFDGVWGLYKAFADGAWQHLDTMHVQHIQVCLIVADQVVANVDKAACGASSFARSVFEQADSAAALTAVWSAPDEWMGTKKSFYDGSVRQFELMLDLQKKLAESAMQPIRRYVGRRHQS